MNKLTIEDQATVINGLVEGCSIRSVERMTGIHRDTIMRLMVRVGNQCEKLMDSTMRNLGCRRLQMDEIWCYVAKKQRHTTVADNRMLVGDKWIFVAIDADSKLIPCYRVGHRTLTDAPAFVGDLSNRLSNRVQLSSDALRAYVEACESFSAMTLTTDK